MRIKNILDTIGGYIKDATLYIVGFLMNIAADITPALRACYRYLRIVVKVGSVLLAIASLLIIVGFIFSSSLLIAIGALISGIVFAIFWFIPDKIANILKDTVGKIPFIDDPVNSLMNTVRSVSVLLLDVAFSVSAVGAMFIMLDAAKLPFWLLLAVALLILTLILFSAYKPESSSWRNVMLSLVVGSSVVCAVFVVWPNTAGDIVSDLTRDTELVTIYKGSCLYEKDGSELKLKRLTDKDIYGYMLSRERSKVSKQDVYLVLLSDSTGNYESGEEVYVYRKDTDERDEPERKIVKEQTETKQINYQQETPKIPSVPKHQDTTITFDGKDSVVFTGLTLMKNCKISYENLTAPIKVIANDDTGEKALIKSGPRTEKMGTRDYEKQRFFPEGESGTVRIHVTRDFYYN